MTGVLEGSWRERLALVLLVLAAVAFVLALNVTPVFNGDFWIQLAVGDAIRASGAIPEIYGFAYTEAANERFVASNWLACLAWSLLYPLGGYPGLVLAKGLGVLVVFGLSVALFRQVDPRPELAIGLGALLVLGINFRSLLRPELIAFALALLSLNGLHAFSRGGRRYWLGVPLVASALWVNIHPSFLLGIAFPFCFAAGALFDARRPNPTALWLGLAGLATLASAALNPYGLELLRVLLLAPESDLLRESIWEWKSPFHPRFRGEPFFWVFVAMLAALCVGAAFSWRQLRGAPVLLVLVTLPLALGAMRHIPWFEIAAGYFLAHAAAPLLARGRGLPIALALAATLGVGTALVFEYGNTRGRHPGFRNDAPLNPEAIAFIEQSGISGAVLNGYRYGDQLAYHFHPRIRIAMDTRIYSERYYREYVSLTGDDPDGLVAPEALRAHLERYDVRAIVTEPKNFRVWRIRGHVPVLQELGFQVVYVDRQTVVLRRREGEG